jgi:hypothetical protein
MSPSYQPPFHNPPTGPCWGRWSFSRAKCLFTNSHLSEPPLKELSHEAGAKHVVTIHGVPRGHPAKIEWSTDWFPEGNGKHSSEGYLLPWLGQTRSPLGSVCGSNPLRGIPFTCDTASHMTEGTDFHISLKYGRSVGFTGGSSNEFFHLSNSTPW